MTQHINNMIGQTSLMGSKFETLTLVDRLIEENHALRHELNLKTGRLRSLQLLVHAFLMGEELPDSDLRLLQATKERSNGV